MPILLTRKGRLRSLTHAANLVKVLLALLERSAVETESCFAALLPCPDKT
jgi:hypothetical protein